MKNLKLKSRMGLLLILGCVMVLSSPNVFNAYYMAAKESSDNFVEAEEVAELRQVEQIAQVDVVAGESVYELDYMPVVLNPFLEALPIISEYELWEMPTLRAVTLKSLTIKDADKVYRHIHWDEAQHVLKNGMAFKVTDVLTGNSWNMVRMGGANHADSITRTPEDTEMILKTWGGEWSWDSRAVVIDTPTGYRMAAALRGMPHGYWIDWDSNEMLGHVCLHFFGSLTHFNNTLVDDAQRNILVAEDYILKIGLGLKV